MQLVETGKVDVGKVGANAAGQAMIATTAETGRYAAERTGRHHDKVTSERIKEDFKDPKEAKQVEKRLRRRMISQERIAKSYRRVRGKVNMP